MFVLLPKMIHVHFLPYTRTMLSSMKSNGCLGSFPICKGELMNQVQQGNTFCQDRKTSF